MKIQSNLASIQLERKTYDIFLHALVFITFIALSNTTFAQSTTGAIPENAMKISYGNGWQCNPGFIKNGETCAEIIAPENAYLTGSSYRMGWLCNHGYRENQGECIAITIPENAYLSPSEYGLGWECNRGYLENKGVCEEIILPENAFLDKSSYEKK